MAQSNLKQPMNQSFNGGGFHSRSSSQPTFFGNNCLPPLSPSPHSDTSRVSSSNANSKDFFVEEIDVSSRGPLISPSFVRESPFRGNESLPPRSVHRRSSSDVPLGFSAMIHSSPQLVPISGQGVFGRTGNVRETFGNDKLVGLKREEMSDFEGIGERKSEGEVVDEFFSSLMNLENVDALNSSGTDDKDKVSSITESGSVPRRGTGSREGVKRSAVGDIAPPARHYRSLSMDSGIGNFHFGDESPKLQSSLSNLVGQLSPSNSVSDNSAKLNLDFQNGEFNDFELKKIMGDERLAEVAISDPKRAKRILANRQSAARSKERRMRYISELEHKVQTLQTEATTLSAQITILQKNYTDLTNQNNEMKFRLQAMDQQAKLRDALHDALTAEVQRLKFESMELREDGRTSNGFTQQGPSKHQMFPMQLQQPNRMERLSMSTSTSTTGSAAPASA